MCPSNARAKRLLFLWRLEGCPGTWDESSPYPRMRRGPQVRRAAPLPPGRRAPRPLHAGSSSMPLGARVRQGPAPRSRLAHRQDGGHSAASASRARRPSIADELGQQEVSPPLPVCASWMRLERVRPHERGQRLCGGRCITRSAYVNLARWPCPQTLRVMVSTTLSLAANCPVPIGVGVETSLNC